MGKSTFETFIADKLRGAGIRVNGPAPWDINVRDPGFYERLAREGSMGLGDSYVNGEYEVTKLDEMIHKIVCADLQNGEISWGQRLRMLLATLLMNKQSKWRATQVGEKHYDLGNDLFEAMLDKRMAYSCGYWKDADTLEAAQEAKLDLVCRKLGLQKGQRVLDIGCGWGSFIAYAVEKYGVEAVGITISKEQKEYVEQKYPHLSLKVLFQDYRDVEGTFDHIVSIGQMEHVGHKNYRIFMQTVERCLKDDGLFLLHTIGGNATCYSTDPWIEKYIFPGGQIPSIAQIARASEGCFVMEDWHNFGPDYDKTLLAWYDNFSRNWSKLRPRYGDRFYRMWRYYLLACAGAFRARYLRLWQVVFTKKGIPGGYTSVR